METYTVDQHTFVPCLLSYSGWVIDAGCRGFNFSKQLLNLGNKVYALDMEEFKYDNHFNKFRLKHAALTHYTGQTEAYFFGNGTGNFLKGINEQPGNTEDRPCETRIVPCITLEEIYKEIGEDIELLKLDIEGSEYQVLESMRPIPKQITVEFHQHCHPILHATYIETVLNRLCKDYHLHLFNCEPKYHFMDCLFIRKDIA